MSGQTQTSSVQPTKLVSRLVFIFRYFGQTRSYVRHGGVVYAQYLCDGPRGELETRCQNVDYSGSSDS